MSFSIGEIAILVESGHRRAGIEVEVLSKPYMHTFMSGCREMAVDTSDPTNENIGGWVTSVSALRKKKPPTEECSWDRVEEISGWNPTKEIVRLTSDEGIETPGYLQ